MSIHRWVPTGLALLCAVAAVLGPGAQLAGAAPLITVQFASRVGTETATLHAASGQFRVFESSEEECDFEHEAGSYYFEYGTTAAYGSRTAEVSIPAEAGSVAEPYESYLAKQACTEQHSASVTLSGLRPGAEYHYRAVATVAGDIEDGPDMTFTTYQPSSSALPDDRLYEMVSPPENNNADIYVPEGGSLTGRNPVDGETITEEPFRAAADGGAVAYAGDPSYEGSGRTGEDLGNEYLSTRGAGGWQTQNIAPLGYTTPTYLAFSPDLSNAVLGEGGYFDREKPPLAQGGLPDLSSLYVHSDAGGGYRALMTEPPSRPNGFGWREEGNIYAEDLGQELPLYAGAASDFSHVLFEANDTLSPEAEYSTKGNNLYDSAGGRLISVNVLPDGKPAPDATFGGDPPQPGEIGGCGGFRVIRPNFSRVISPDGSRIVWADLSTEVAPEDPAGLTRLFLRENDASSEPTTVQVDASQGPGPSGGGVFWTASADESKVFFTDAPGLTGDSVAGSGANLYEFEAPTGRLVDLTGGAAQAEVQGVIGASEDGEYVYFVAAGALAEGAVAGQPNLYLRHDGTTRLVAALSAADNGYRVGCARRGDWWPVLGDRTSEVTPSGHGVVFESVNRLTGYDNEGAREVYVYDAESGQLACASCQPTGAPPSQGAYLPVGGKHDVTYQPRWISDEGGRVFFETAEALAQRDTNGQPDVYEWERDGTGSCGEARGCVYLLSGGTSPSPSYLIDASAEGEDVFFVTRAQLVPQDVNDNVNLYDAHAGGVLPPAEAQCTGTGCQGAPLPPTAFEAPASSTFAGVGNFPPQAGVEAHKPAKKRRVRKKKRRRPASRAGRAGRRAGRARPTRGSRSKEGRR